MAEVEEDLVPEPGVEQVQDGVLGAADVEINPRLGGIALSRRPHPVALGLRSAKGAGVVGVQIAQVIPAAAGPLRHGVGFARGAVRQVHPVLGAGQRRLAVRSGLVVLKRWRQHRKIGLRQGLVVGLPVATGFQTIGKGSPQ